MQTRDQKLALAVYNRVQSFDKPTLSDAQRKQYGSMAHKLPILIRTAGLSQALAFIEARHRQQKPEAPLPPQLHLLRDLEHVLRENGMLSGTNLFATARIADLGEYMRLTQHTLAALLWFKRYAQSVLGVEQGEYEEERSHE